MPLWCQTSLRGITEHVSLIRSSSKVNLGRAKGAAWPSLRSTSAPDTAWVGDFTLMSLTHLTLNWKKNMTHICTPWWRPSAPWSSHITKLRQHENAFTCAPITAGLLFICLPLECDFEESHLCGYNNQWNANVNWYVGGGGVHVLHNDMPNDHTYNNGSGEQEWFVHIITGCTINDSWRVKLVLVNKLTTTKLTRATMGQSTGTLIQIQIMNCLGYFKKWNFINICQTV